MSKKLITACMALVALAAFALPAVASASPELTHPTGSTLATGSKIKATNIGATKLIAGGTTLIECATSTMTGTLTKNSGTETEGTIESTTFSGTATEGKCTSNFGGATTIHTNIGNGTPWCLRATSAMATNEFQVRGNSCSSEARSITFVITNSIGTCKYNRTTALKGTITTDTGGSPTDAILHLTPSANTEFTKEEGGILCPSTGQLEMSYTLELDQATATPVWIS